MNTGMSGKFEENHPPQLKCSTGNSTCLELVSPFITMLKEFEQHLG